MPPLDDPPAPIDLAHATPEELGEACTARDAYIAYLIQRLRQIESLGHVPNSWAGLENVPDELRVRSRGSRTPPAGNARLAEVELSLQRAKLAREELRIRVMDEQMQKDIKRAKDASDSQADDSGDSKGDQGKQPLETHARPSRRRLRRLRPHSGRRTATRTGLQPGSRSLIVSRSLRSSANVASIF